MTVRISAAMIVRDEAHHLEECLASMDSLVDEVVVVDTGSVDGSAALATRLGARVSHLTWTGDFAAARNDALTRCIGDWILYIDADERVRASAGTRERLDDPAVVAGLCRFQTKPNLTRYWEYRLFRNRPDIRYHGVIHETMVGDIQRIERDEGLVVMATPLEIDHLGYVGDQSHKHRRNRPLLEVQVQADPDRSYLWFHLGQVRAAQGDRPGAEQAWRQGVAASRDRERAVRQDLLCYTELTLSLVQRDDPETADLVSEATRRFGPDEILVRWIDANAQLAQGNWTAAEAQLTQLAAIDADELVDEQLAYDRGIFGSLAWHGLGLCCFQQGRYDEAAMWFERAEVQAATDDGETGTDPELRIKRVLAQRRATSGR